MLGGKHFKKKMDKKAKKKEAKRGTTLQTKSSNDSTFSIKNGRGDRAQQHSSSSFQGRSNGSQSSTNSRSGANSSAPPSRFTKQKSTLKGPVVDYGGGEKGDRDGANDRQRVPFKNRQEARTYQMQQQRRGKKGIRGDAGSAVQISNDAQDARRASLASSQAQRRRVLRRKGGEDLLSHFKSQLTASTFRLLNEEMYHSSTAYGAQLLREEATFKDYHQGYRQQLAQWPVNPNEIVVQSLLQHKRGLFTPCFLPHSNDSSPTEGKKNSKGGQKNAEGSTEVEEESMEHLKESTSPHPLAPSKRSIPRHWVVADLGCGEAQIAEALLPFGYTVHSFDLCAINERVTVADSSKVPLPDASVDVCVFSLSLMATDYEKSVLEALRILKPKGLLKIIEVRSRIPSPQRFSECIESMGCSSEGYDVVGDYFAAFDFTKKEKGSLMSSNFAHPPGEVLLPSLYKKR